MSRFCRCRFGWHPEWRTSEKTCQCRTKSISTDRESNGDTWWWLEGLVCGENFASAHGKLTQDYSRILLPAIRSFSWCLIDCPRDQRSCSDGERGLQRCRASLSPYSNLSRYHHPLIAQTFAQALDDDIHVNAFQGALLFGMTSVSNVCVSRTLGAKFWWARPKKLLDATESNAPLSGKGENASIVQSRQFRYPSIALHWENKSVE